MGLFKRAKQDLDANAGMVSSVIGAVADAGSLAAQVAHEQAGTIQATQEMLSKPGHRETAARAARIMNSGLPAAGTIQSANMVSAETAEFVVALTEGPGAPRTITFQEDVASLAIYPVGKAQQVKLDPDNTNDAMLWVDLPNAGDLKISQLEHLAQMHASGSIPDQTYEMLKARILGSP